MLTGPDSHSGRCHAPPIRFSSRSYTCTACHGAEGKGGVGNAGSADGTVPPLNPIDASLQNKDPKVFAYNLDLFIQHGSAPGGPSPALKMANWGEAGSLKQQQISDVIAYIMSLNPVK